MLSSAGGKVGSAAVNYWIQIQQSVLSTAQVRGVDQLAVKEYGMHSLVLMENAALGCVQWLLRRQPSPAQTVILCGRGNNGGDGLAIARHLQVHGWNCQVWVLGPREQLSPDNRSNLDILLAHGGPGPGLEIRLVDASTGHAPRDPTSAQSLDPIRSADVIVDAMLGSGASGNPRPPFREWIDEANKSDALRVAIDIPTGIDAETGAQGSPAFRAHATLTFVANKPAMTLPNAPALFGELSVLPIGIPEHLIGRFLDEASG